MRSCLALLITQMNLGTSKTMRYLQRARMLPPDEYPDWVLHCEAFLLCMTTTAKAMGEFKVDVTQVITESGILVCDTCGYILPALRGYMIASGEFAGQVVALDTVELAEDPLEPIPDA